MGLKTISPAELRNLTEDVMDAIYDLEAHQDEKEARPASYAKLVASLEALEGARRSRKEGTHADIINFSVALIQGRKILNR